MPGHLEARELLEADRRHLREALAEGEQDEDGRFGVGPRFVGIACLDRVGRAEMAELSLSPPVPVEVAVEDEDVKDWARPTSLGEAGAVEEPELVVEDRQVVGHVHPDNRDTPLPAVEEDIGEEHQCVPEATTFLSGPLGRDPVDGDRLGGDLPTGVHEARDPAGDGATVRVDEPKGDRDVPVAKDTGRLEVDAEDLLCMPRGFHVDPLGCGLPIVSVRVPTRCAPSAERACDPTYAPGRIATMGDEDRTGALSPAQWTRDVAKMRAGEPLDVVIVGGGVVGAGAAFDAASRGLRVGLLEAEDWASGTSSRSSKLAHGGLRYLRMLDISLVREALRERTFMLRAAPHLVRPATFVYPLRHRFSERAFVGLGVSLYDLLARWSGSTLERHRNLSRAEALVLAPGLRTKALVGAIQYSDAQVDDARYVVALVRSAVARGALAVSRAAVVGFRRDGDRVTGVRVRLTETGEELVVACRSVVVAAGVWNDELERLGGIDRTSRIVPSKGVHLVVAKDRIESSVALIVPTRRSVLFVLPWGDHWLIGTTDTPWTHDRSRPAASRADVDYLLGEVNAVLTSPLAREDVVSVYVGLRPLLGEVADETTKLSREHLVARPIDGLVTVSGGKFTTYRLMASDAIDAAVTAGGLEAPPSDTAALGLVGGDGYAMRWAHRDELGTAAGLETQEVERLLGRYGSLADEVLSLVSVGSPMRLSVPGAPGYLRAEILHAVSHEGARHLEDVLVRRTRAALETTDRGVHAANDVAALMAGPLGWDDAALRHEVEAYRSSVRAQVAAEGAPDDERASERLSSLRRPLGRP